jgi:hypothetical protein
MWNTESGICGRYSESRRKIAQKTSSESPPSSETHYAFLRAYDDVVESGIRDMHMINSCAGFLWAKAWISSMVLPKGSARVTQSPPMWKYALVSKMESWLTSSKSNLG